MRTRKETCLKHFLAIWSGDMHWSSLLLTYRIKKLSAVIYKRSLFINHIQRCNKNCHTFCTRTRLNTRTWKFPTAQHATEQKRPSVNWSVSSQFVFVSLYVKDVKYKPLYENWSYILHDVLLGNTLWVRLYANDSHSVNIRTAGRPYKWTLSTETLVFLTYTPEHKSLWIKSSACISSMTQYKTDKPKR